MTQVFTGPPTIKPHPTSQLVNSSMNITLKCRGTGKGSITYHWETSNINGGQWMIINRGRKNLVVSNLEQSQQYRCVVSNEAGSTTSDVITVTLLRKLYYKHHTILVLVSNRDHHSTKQFCLCCGITRFAIILFGIY